MRSQNAVACSHDGFYSIKSWYDRGAGVLVFYWTCERCGVWLGEVSREPYRPDYDPRGYARFLTVATH